MKVNFHRWFSDLCDTTVDVVKDQKTQRTQNQEPHTTENRKPSALMIKNQQTQNEENQCTDDQEPTNPGNQENQCTDDVVKDQET